MKIKLLIIILMLLLLVPVNSVSALEKDDEGYKTVSEVVKYYRTEVIKNENASIEEQYEIVDYEISEKEYNNPNIIKAANTRGNPNVVETNYKRMTTSISTNGSNYRYKNILVWKLIPKVRSYDIIAIGYLSNVTPASTSFRQEYCYSSGGCMSSITSSGKQFSTGYGRTFKLPTGQLSSLKITLIVDVQKKNNSTITSQAAYGDYAHAVSSVSLSDALNYQVIQSSGIVHDSSVASYFDTIPVSGVYWNGTW